MQSSSSMLLLSLLALRALVSAKSVTVPFNAEQVTYFAPVAEAGVAASGEPWAFLTGANAENACAGSGSGNAMTTVAGAGFEFEFVGTAVSLITAPSSAYSISIDGGAPTLVHTQSAKRAAECSVTYASVELLPGRHKVHVAATDSSSLVFLRAIVNDGDLGAPQPVIASQSQQEPQSLEVTPTSNTTTSKQNIGIIIGVTITLVVVLLLAAILGIRLWQRRRKAGLTKGPIDLEAKPAMLEVQPRTVPRPLVLPAPRKNSGARSSWTSFGGGRSGSSEPDVSEKDRDSLVDDTLTLLRPPVGPSSRKEKKPRHPFRVPTLHPTRPRAGTPPLRLSI